MHRKTTSVPCGNCSSPCSSSDDSASDDAVQVTGGGDGGADGDRYASALCNRSGALQARSDIGAEGGSDVATTSPPGDHGKAEVVVEVAGPGRTLMEEPSFSSSTSAASPEAARMDSILDYAAYVKLHSHDKRKRN